jgi:hypothetical protein
VQSLLQGVGNVVGGGTNIAPSVQGFLNWTTLTTPRSPHVDRHKDRRRGFLADPRKQ